MSRPITIHHIALTVTDADASVEFYRALLGVEEALRHDDDTVTVRVLDGDGFLLGLRQYHHHPDDRFSEFRTGMDHFAFGVADRESLTHFERRLDELDAVYTPTCESPIGPVLVFRDPDGIQGEFCLAPG